MASKPLVEPSAYGLFCAAGGFHIDPWSPVERALVTHAHSDHARWGCGSYLTNALGEGLLRQRVGVDARIETLAPAETREINGVRASFHPAGHVLGSSQIRLEHDGETWVISGDYATQSNATCEPFEPVACDVFISECTFGLPVYRWPEPDDVFASVNAWWRSNQERNRTSVIFAYALGKAQRVLAGLDPRIGPILVHGAVDRLLPAYRSCGVRLPATERAAAENAKATRGRAMVIAPPSAAGSPWIRKFGSVSTAYVSGWMRVRGARRWRSADRGFVLSDHADFDGLNAAIDATGAKRVILTHGFTEAMSRWLASRGYETAVYRTRYETQAEDAEPENETKT